MVETCRSQPTSQLVLTKEQQCISYLEPVCREGTVNRSHRLIKVHKVDTVQCTSYMGPVISQQEAAVYQSVWEVKCASYLISL